jgi:hypothetical protein
MDYLEKAAKLLKSYGILNDRLACDIAILVIEAQKEIIQAQLNESENK